MRQQAKIFYLQRRCKSPTVATESLLLTCIADVEEHRDVALVGIPSAFIQARVQHKKDVAIIKIRVVIVDILLELFQDIYEPYVTTDLKEVKQLVGQY